MFIHKHPYQPFIRPDTEKLIVGTLPPPRFSTGELLAKDVDIQYGSYYNSLWSIIDKIHDLGLSYDNSDKAISERKRYLIENKIGICDVVKSAEREKVNASDLGMKNIELRDVIRYLKEYPNVHTLLFTGGNSKNGPEYFFRKLLKNYNLKLHVVSNEVPRIHEFYLDREDGVESGRRIKTVSLTSASGSANRAIGSMSLYQHLKNKNPDFTTNDFRVMQYREYF